MAKACPDCGSNLGPSAIKCRCGWRVVSVAPQFLSECAHMGCNVGAKVNVKTPTGYANLCMGHYDSKALSDAKAWLADRGLETMAEQRSFWRKQVEILKAGQTDYRGWQRNPKSEIAQKFVDEINAGRRLPVRERVPGEDDEPIEEIA